MKTRDVLLTVAILVLITAAHSKDPCKNKRCSKRQMCVSVVSSCKIQPCARIARCIPNNTPRMCPSVRCRPCGKGKVTKYDSNGCLTCDCYDPCEGITVSPLQECVANFQNGVGYFRYSTPKLLCYASGDPHYHTFDGAVFHYMGTGTFIMSERSPGEKTLTDYRLIGYHKTLDKPNVSYLMWIELTVFLPGKTTSVRIGAGLHITINVNNQVYTDNAMPPGITSIDKNTGTVITTFGVVVKFDGVHEGKIWVPMSYRFNVDGLCGNADGDGPNDYVSKTGRNCYPLPDNKKYWCVGNSWRADRRPGKEQTVDKVKLTCSAPNKRTFKKNSYCGALKNRRGPFRKCLKSKRTEGKNSYSSCIFDTCANQNNKALAKSLACQSVEGYAQVCGGLVTSNWRRVTGCLCPGELEWTKCGKPCTRTCARPDVCNGKCVARCQCPPSKPYQQGNSCVDMSTCRKLNQPACKGDLVYTTCGRECTRTCRQPYIHCGFHCVKKCQCPRSKPYNEGDICYDKSGCMRLDLWPHV